MNRIALPPGVIFLTCVVVVGLIGLLEFSSGDEFELYVLYLIPIGMAAWLAGWPAALFMAALATGMSLVVDVSGDSLHANPFAELWNLVVQGAVYFVVAGLAALDKALLDRERRLTRQLGQALADVKQLSGLLPLCVSCKKVRNDQGYWETVENYLETHAAVEVGQGLCPECMQSRLGASEPGAAG